MKHRTGYVSNSSSSSFVVIPDEVVKNYNKNTEARMMESFDRMKLVFDFTTMSPEWFGIFWNYETQFGWQVVNYHGMRDKWNWLVLQACYAKRQFDDEKYCRMLDKYVQSFGRDVKIEWSRIDAAIDNIDAYIDHQSIEPKDNFDEVEKIGIDEFLSNEDCYISNSNDNGGDDEKPEERF